MILIYAEVLIGNFRSIGGKTIQIETHRTQDTSVGTAQSVSLHSGPPVTFLPPTPVYFNRFSQQQLILFVLAAHFRPFVSPYFASLQPFYPNQTDLLISIHFFLVSLL